MLSSHAHKDMWRSRDRGSCRGRQDVTLIIYRSGGSRNAANEGEKKPCVVPHSAAGRAWHRLRQGGGGVREGGWRCDLSGDAKRAGNVRTQWHGEALRIKAPAK